MAPARRRRKFFASASPPSVRRPVRRYCCSPAASVSALCSSAPPVQIPSAAPRAPGFFSVPTDLQAAARRPDAACSHAYGLPLHCARRSRLQPAALDSSASDRAPQFLVSIISPPRLVPLSSPSSQPLDQPALPSSTGVRLRPCGTCCAASFTSRTSELPPLPCFSPLLLLRFPFLAAAMS